MRFDIRAILSVIVLSSFFLVLVVMTVWPVVIGLPDPQVYRDQMKEFAALCSGIVGAIIGYYFGTEKSGRADKNNDAGGD